MIDACFTEIEQTLQSFHNILRLTLTKKKYNATQGYVSGSVHFDNGRRLEFMELRDTERTAKVKYRYQYMDEQNACIFRYDNAPHHPEFATFPHHKHQGDAIAQSFEPTLFDVLLEIAGQERWDREHERYDAG
jgi:hypothetical protein